MLMTNGIGATIGTLSAQAVVNYFVNNAAARGVEPSWSTAWYIFAAYALVVAFLFMILFKEPKDNAEKVA
jgi:sugar phosphate permease